MPEEYVFHYTSREAAQDIINEGKIKAGPLGRIFLTDGLYSSGAEAADRLGIVSKPVEVVFLIPHRLVTQGFDIISIEVDIGSPERIDSVRDTETGQLLRKGGGTQYKVSGEISFANIPIGKIGSYLIFSP